MSLLDTCRRTARRTFGIERLRPEQESAMLAILEGRDALVALPTGFGKSLIYQVPAMVLERPTIVISPLIALMADQERALKDRGVPVVALHSGLRAAECRAAIERLEDGGRLVVLTTPETLGSRAIAPCFVRARPALLCVDEAHCISEMGPRLPTVLLAARRRPRAAWQSARARTYGDRNAARSRRYRRAAPPPRPDFAHCSRAPQKSSVDCRNCSRSAEVQRDRPIHPVIATARDHILRHDHRG